MNPPTEMPASLKSLYRTMLRIRMIEEAIAEKYSELEMRCPVHLSIGQEAAAAGACAAVRESDYAMSGHRSHAHYLAKGGSLKRMLAELYGRETGCCKGKGGSMHLTDLGAGFLGAVPIVASTIPISVGAAFTSQMRGEDRVTLDFLGEGATEEGVFHESINFASLKKLPIVFVCENNLYSVYTPMEPRQPAHREVYQQAIGHGVEGFKVDGNDVASVQEAVSKAVDKARRKGGPTFIELTTYRWREHCGPNYDNDIGYRTQDEFQSWKEKCPVSRTSKELKANGQLTDEEEKAMISEFECEINAAFSFAQNSPYPRIDAMTDFVYAE